MSQDPFGTISDMVPKGITSAGMGSPKRSVGERRDRPLGRRGADALAHVPLFAGLSKRHLRRIAEHTDEVAIGAGDTIVAEGERGGAFYVILEGEARVIRGGRTVARLGATDFFGEMALLDDQPRNATVIATTPLRALRLFKQAFVEVMHDEPAVAVQILSTVAQRLRGSERSARH